MTKLVKFKPAPGFILLKPIDEKENKGLSLQTRIQNFCEVIKVGPTVFGEFNGKAIYAPCEVGDKVYHTTTGWEDINIGGEVFRIIKFQNILGKV